MVKLMSAKLQADSAQNASQQFAWQTLGPLFVGLMLQIFVAGMCYVSAGQILTAKKSPLSKKMKAILAVTLILNTVSLGSSVANLLLWGTTQHRDEASLVSATIVDACKHVHTHSSSSSSITIDVDAPILAGLTAFVVQSYFANRAWKVRFGFHTR